MAEKLYYSMGEVAEMFDVNQSLIRHWERQFSVLKPQRNKKGNRLFTSQDVENLKLIYHLVKERGMTLDGAKKALRQRAPETGIGRDAELMERLQKIRSLLVEVREDLKTDDGVIVTSDESIPESVAEEIPAPAQKSRRKAVVQIDDATGSEVLEEEAKPQPVRKPRRKKEEVENKELFAFYEQSLF